MYNCKKGVKIFEGPDEGDAETLNNELGEILSIGNVKDILHVEYYNKTLTQNGIDVYNQIIGGYTQEDGTKIKGVNEYVNLYNQTRDKKTSVARKTQKTDFKRQLLVVVFARKIQRRFRIAFIA